MRIYLIKLGLIGFNKKNCERVILTELQEKYIRNANFLRHSHLHQSKDNCKKWPSFYLNYKDRQIIEGFCVMNGYRM